jgi:hypothetical protein
MPFKQSIHRAMDPTSRGGAIGPSPAIVMNSGVERLYRIAGKVSKPTGNPPTKCGYGPRLGLLPQERQTPSEPLGSLQQGVRQSPDGPSGNASAVVSGFKLTAFLWKLPGAKKLPVEVVLGGFSLRKCRQKRVSPKIGFNCRSSDFCFPIP